MMKGGPVRVVAALSQYRVRVYRFRDAVEIEVDATLLSNPCTALEAAQHETLRRLHVRAARFGGNE